MCLELLFFEKNVVKLIGAIYSSSRSSHAMAIYTGFREFPMWQCYS